MPHPSLLRWSASAATASKSEWCASVVPCLLALGISGGCSGTPRPPSLHVLSDILTLESQVQLETSDSCLIGRIAKGLSISGGRIYIADDIGKQVLEFDGRGRFVRKLGAVGNRPGEFQSPKDVVALPSGQVFVYDGLTNHVIEFDTLGRFVSSFSPSRSNVLMWGEVSGKLLAVGILFSDRYSIAATFIEPSEQRQVACLQDFLEFPRLTAQFSEPYNIPGDESGNFFFLEPGSLRILKVSSMGNVLEISNELPSLFRKARHDVNRDAVLEAPDVLHNYTPPLGFAYAKGLLFVIWKDINVVARKQYLEVFDKHLHHLSTSIEISDNLFPFIFTDGIDLFLLCKSSPTKEGAYQNPAIQRFAVIGSYAGLNH